MGKWSCTEADTIKVGTRLTDGAKLSFNWLTGGENNDTIRKKCGLKIDRRLDLKKLVPWLIGTNKPNDSTGKHATRGNCSKIMVFRNWSGVTRRTGRPRTRPKHTTRLSGEFPPCRVIGYKWSLSFTAHQLLVCRPCLAILAPEKLHVAREVGGRIRIPAVQLGKSTRNKPWLPSSDGAVGKKMPDSVVANTQKSGFNRFVISKIILRPHDQSEVTFRENRSRRWLEWKAWAAFPGRRDPSHMGLADDSRRCGTSLLNSSGPDSGVTTMILACVRLTRLRVTVLSIFVDTKDVDSIWLQSVVNVMSVAYECRRLAAQQVTPEMIGAIGGTCNNGQRQDSGRKHDRTQASGIWNLESAAAGHKSRTRAFGMYLWYKHLNWPSRRRLAKTEQRQTAGLEERNGNKPALADRNLVILSPVRRSQTTLSIEHG
ncbi:hypothetical protein CCUS01_07672 [Colletotrichum cuscutae]|uniref:Uncharacterized protein n=1 Tax=Colletotrichum cuscutae TaxID=1209917 RepID=A0AAI9UXE9_9PEZI|nr:hypothetical protein CCUS01_07672 [Colletotrichum cuscutae]